MVGFLFFILDEVVFTYYSIYHTQKRFVCTWSIDQLYLPNLMIINNFYYEEAPVSTFDFAYMLREYILRCGYLCIGFSDIEVYKLEEQYQEILPKVITGLIAGSLRLFNYETEGLCSVYHKTDNAFQLMPFTLVKKESHGDIPKES
jgi:hypothetical protein